MDKTDHAPARGKKARLSGNGHDKGPGKLGAPAAKGKPSIAIRNGGHNGKPSPGANRKTAAGGGGKALSGSGATPDAGGERDWSKTLFLPKTGFGMKAGLPQLEPKLLGRWAKMGLYKQLRKTAKGREKFVAHDGPPYANGNIHIGHAANKILKDAVVRSRQMMGFDANYVPGFDCHGLPIEWKVEEGYRARGKNKDDVPVPAFRAECRDFAQKWIDVQIGEFKRLGIEGDWERYYTTMAYASEAAIAGELMKFAMNGSLYRGSKPVMWSVVERTALAEAEVEYQEVQSPAIWVKFPVGEVDEGAENRQAILDAKVVIWTTTPWTIPANRAISFSIQIAYSVYEVTEVEDAPDGTAPWTKVGEKLILADCLAEPFMKAARVKTFTSVSPVKTGNFMYFSCNHPLHDAGYDFEVPFLVGDHVTDETGTGFVHTAPGHGADDFEVWTANSRILQDRGIDTVVPDTVGPDGFYRKDVPLFGGDTPKRVIDDKGNFGKLDDMRYANAAVIAALKDAGMLAAMNPRYKHDYPHSWRSKAPVIFRNTPQWFVALDKPVAVKGQKAKHTIREMALKAIGETRFVPPQGRNRIGAMIANRPDYVISRQRVWGVPIAIFVHKETGAILPGPSFKNSKAYVKRAREIFEAEGVDTWFAATAPERFLGGIVDDPSEWEQVRDTLDVWFDSACTHVFVLRKRRDLKWPADVYIEGSDQHRGWFHSSLLESCGTTGRAPYDALVTHGFVNDENGRKMSKSLGNTTAPQKVIEANGADILRLWALSSDYTDDLRIGPAIVQSTVDGYRKLRNTLRYLLGNLAHYEGTAVAYNDLPELERWVLHRAAVLDKAVREAYADYDFRRSYRAIAEFCSADLSSLYFDIRKDTLYCEPYSSANRRAALFVLHTLFEVLTRWVAPLLPFTAEEAWLARHGTGKGVSVHLQTFVDLPPEWRDDALAAKWEKVFAIRHVVTGALEVERREKRIGSSLEAAPVIYIADKSLAALAKDVDWAGIAIASGAELRHGKAPAGAFKLETVAGVAVVPKLAKGQKCARSWRIGDDIGADAAFPALSTRDAAAVREFDAKGDV